jgi:hypothetical protein
MNVPLTPGMVDELAGGAYDARLFRSPSVNEVRFPTPFA